MNSYTLKKVNGAPNWDAIEALNIDIPYRTSAPIQAWAKLAWDETGIYVNLRAKEEHIRCEETGPLPMICQDSCLEFFFRPTESMAYFNFEFNPACGLWLGHGLGVTDLIRLVPFHERELFQSESYRTEDGWGITFYVPFSFVRHFFPDFEAYEGLKFYGNCYKCGDFTVQPHYLSWNKIDLPKLTFHAPEFFGQMILGGE